MDQHPSISTWVANITGSGAIVASLMGYLPSLFSIIAAMTAAGWYGMQIYESKTVQRWAATRRARKLARLKAQVMLLEARYHSLLPGPDEGGAALVPPADRG